MSWDTAVQARGCPTMGKRANKSEEAVPGRREAQGAKDQEMKLKEKETHTHTHCSAG